MVVILLYDVDDDVIASTDTTDIIVYAAVGVSGLIVVSFMYVCIKKVRKK